MNLSILLKILTGLAVVTEKDPNGDSVSAYALSLKQALDILSRDPNASLQLNQIIAQCVCNDWATFEEVGQFVAACLTNGLAAKIPEALAQFNNMASKVALRA
jgi:hypothetical protein